MKYLVLLLAAFSLFGGAEVSAQAESYTTIIEVKDYGPTITKLVLTLTEEVNTDDLSPETFSVEATKTYDKFNEESGENEEITETGAIEVVDVYTSDEEGEPVEEASNVVTLELEVHPDNVLTSPFNYNMLTGRNTDVGVSHVISLEEPLGNLEELSLTVDSQEEIIYEGTTDYTTDVYTYEDETFGEIELEYAYYEVESEEPAPLIVLLHGGGEGGNDTNLVLLGNKVVALNSKEIQAYFEDGVNILAPQSPTMWLDDGSGEMTTNGDSMYTEALSNLITEFVDTHDNIDQDRVYLGGGSNGGYMTLNLAIENPGYFAAIFPICHAYQSEWIDEDELAVLSETPTWFIHALNDVIVEYEPTTGALHERLVEAGHENLHLTTFDNVVDTSGEFQDEEGNPYEYLGHWSWIYFFNDEVTDEAGVNIYEWLAEQSN